MNKSIMELLEEVSGIELLLAIFLLVAIGVLISTQKSRLLKLLNKWRKTQNEEEDFHSLVYELKESFESLSKVVKQNQENRDKELLKYRDDSRKIRDKMYEVMDRQSQSISELKETVLEIQEKNSETKRAEIKERIERIYRECTHEQVCTEMQFETLKDLIEQYEKRGGDNSFVHSIVQIEMYQWKVVKEVRIFNLSDTIQKICKRYDIDFFKMRLYPFYRKNILHSECLEC